MSDNVQRPYLMPDGSVKMIGLNWCHCTPEKRRGPPGGVCWCGGAIPECNHDKSSMLEVTTMDDKQHSYLCPICRSVVLGDLVSPAEEMKMKQEFDMFRLRSINE